MDGNLPTDLPDSDILKVNAKSSGVSSPDGLLIPYCSVSEFVNDCWCFLDEGEAYKSAALRNSIPRIKAYSLEELWKWRKQPSFSGTGNFGAGSKSFAYESRGAGEITSNDTA